MYKLSQELKNSLMNVIEEIVKIQIDELKTQLIKEINLKENKEFLTRTETAKLFGVSTNTIHLWKRDGKINLYKMGNRSFYKYSELLEVLYEKQK